jgi:ubiquitin-conjugating enzyme (huntingtin interacting protein 2)
LASAWSPVLTIKSALLSLQSLLSTPEPKDPQDAEVANMLMRNPKEFERVASEWAVKYANAPKRDRAETSGGATESTLKQRQKKSREEEEAERLAEYVSSDLLSSGITLTRLRYGGYNTEMIDNFVNMGFDRDRVVSAFQYVGLDTNEGEIYELEEAYIGDITARLLGEP